MQFEKGIFIVRETFGLIAQCHTRSAKSLDLPGTNGEWRCFEKQMLATTWPRGELQLFHASSGREQLNIADLPFAEGSLELKRRREGVGTPVFRFMENLRLLNISKVESVRGVEELYVPGEEL
jgi:hypothetical protein